MTLPGTLARRAAIALLLIISLPTARLATALELNDATDADQAEVWIELAREHLDRADFGEATRLAESAVAAIDVTTPAAIDAQILLAECYNSVGRYDEALVASRAALARSRELHGDAHPVVADALAGLSTTVWRRADHAEAERLQREALAMRREFFPENSDPVMSSLAALGLILNSDRRFEESVASHEPAIAIGRELYGGDHAELAGMLSNYSIPLQHLRRFDDAEAALNEARAMMQRLGRDDDPSVTYMIQNLGGLSIYRNDLPRAHELYRQVEARHLREKGEAFEGVVAGRMALGKIAYRMDDLERSRAMYASAAVSYDLGRLRAGRGIERAAFWESPYEKLGALEVERKKGPRAAPRARLLQEIREIVTGGIASVNLLPKASRCLIEMLPKWTKWGGFNGESYDDVHT